MADTFRTKVTALCDGLVHDSERPVAREALRGILEAIVIPPEPDGLLQVCGAISER